MILLQPLPIVLHVSLQSTPALHIQEQKLRPGEKIDMPVFFYIDPEFATDPRLKGVDNLTLSYTFFKVWRIALDCLEMHSCM